MVGKIASKMPPHNIASWKSASFLLDQLPLPGQKAGWSQTGLNRSGFWTVVIVLFHLVIWCQHSLQIHSNYLTGLVCKHKYYFWNIAYSRLKCKAVWNRFHAVHWHLRLDINIKCTTTYLLIFLWETKRILCVPTYSWRKMFSLLTKWKVIWKMQKKRIRWISQNSSICTTAHPTDRHQ